MATATGNGALTSGVSATIDRRSNRLARLLARLGVAPSDRVGVACCDAHAEDSTTAHLAAVKASATTASFCLDGEPNAIRVLADLIAPRVVLACAEGGELWQRAGCRGILVSDVPGAYWWRALEAEESAETFDDDGVPAPLRASGARGETWPCFVSRVHHGKRLGRKIGFPTANLRVPDAAQLVDDGVYASWLVRGDGSTLPGAASLGVRPTVERDGERLLEVHVLDRDEWIDLYDEVVAVHLVKPLRPEQRFDGLDALTARIRRDCDDARAVLATAPPPSPTVDRTPD